MAKVFDNWKGQDMCMCVHLEFMKSLEVLRKSSATLSVGRMLNQLARC